MTAFDLDQLPPGGIYRKLAEAQAILTLLSNDLGMEIEAGNDTIGLNIYQRALQSAQDLISPCFASLDNLRTAKTPATKEAIADYVEALDKKAWTVQRRLYSLEACLDCIRESLEICSDNINPTEALGTAIAEAATLADLQETIVDGIKKLSL
jgi:hypothetical protein